MLAQLWRETFGIGVIDVHADQASQSLSIGDISGKVAIVDYFGNLLFEQKVELPIWGVAHYCLENGVIVTVTAEADKQSQIGAVSIFHDDNLIKRVTFDAPAWDVTFVEDGGLIAVTDWGGTLRLFDSADGSTFKEAKHHSPLYGVSGKDLSSLKVCADREGILKYDVLGNSFSKVLPFKSACYNICESSHEGLISVGSHGPTISIFDNNGEILGSTESISTIAVNFYESLLIFGGKTGELSIRSRHDFDRNLSRVLLKACIWNISIDPNASAVFAALGDGSVAAFHVEASNPSIQISENFLKNRKLQSETNLFEVIDDEIHPTFIVSAILEDISTGVITKEEALELYEILRKNDLPSVSLDSDFSLTLGVLSLYSENAAVAISHLAQVDRLSPHYSLAVTLLARAYTATGRGEEATRLLAKHLEQLDRSFQVQALSVISHPQNMANSPNALEKLVTGVARKQSNKPAAVSKLVNNDINLFLSGTNANSDPRGEVDYGIINYIKYEFASRPDHIKKVLEMAVVDEVLGNELRNSDGIPLSLDIGCATCRWPKYFASKGFLAHGYDVDPEAVRICKSIAGNNEHIKIEQRNILETPAEEDRYTLISTMMGTFNHIPRENHHKFLEWIFQSLRIGGILIFSSWSTDCLYTSYLQFYKSEERRAIRENSRPLDSLNSLLKDIGYLVREIIPFTFLPDKCYEAWMEHVTEEAIVSIDNKCRENLPASQAQMVLYVAEKV